MGFPYEPEIALGIIGTGTLLGILSLDDMERPSDQARVYSMRLFNVGIRDLSQEGKRNQ